MLEIGFALGVMLFVGYILGEMVGYGRGLKHACAIWREGYEGLARILIECSKGR